MGLAWLGAVQLARGPLGQLGSSSGQLHFLAPRRLRHLYWPVTMPGWQVGPCSGGGGGGSSGGGGEGQCPSAPAASLWSAATAVAMPA